MKTLILTAAVALAALPVAAQEGRGMGAALTMLELEVARAFDRYEVQADVMDLSLNQVFEITQVLDQATNGGGVVATRQKIEAALNRQ